MLESLFAELLEEWPASAAGGGNNVGATIKGVPIAPVTHSPITATDVFDSFINLVKTNKLSKACTPLFNPRIAAWGKRVTDALSSDLPKTLALEIEKNFREKLRNAEAADKFGGTKKSNFWAEILGERRSGTEGLSGSSPGVSPPPLDTVF